HGLSYFLSKISVPELRNNLNDSARVICAVTVVLDGLFSTIPYHLYWAFSQSMHQEKRTQQQQQQQQQLKALAWKSRS
ncbi:hypothetical protein STEG23_023443, partial [Scotinomys teguina]